MAERAGSLARQQAPILVSLAVLTLAAWAILIGEAHGMSDTTMGLTMGMNFALFLAVWLVMMAAMMFPAAAPMVLTFARVQAGKRQQGHRSVSVWIFVAAYLAIWGSVGAVAYGAAAGAEVLGRTVPWIGDNGPRFGGVVLIAAGIYQLTPLKRVCLRQCRSPIAFVLTSWRDGTAGALRMGVRHGLYCLGCCWLLFAILFPLGMMNIALLALVTFLIFAEKSLPRVHRLPWGIAAVLVTYGIAVVLSPGILPIQPPHGTVPM